MKLVTLIENRLGNNPNLICEFGFSIFIQDEDISLIFDTGQSGIFTKNISQLSIDPKQIKNIVISHNHFDHGGGLKQYIQSFGNDFSLYLNRTFFDERIALSEFYSRILKADFSQNYLKNSGVRINFINDHIHILSKNITLFTNFKRENNFENVNSSYFRRKDNNFISDDMSDEVVLGLNTSIGLFLVCGCSHIGIVNIIENIKKWTGMKIVGIIGGLHLSKAKTDRIKKTIDYLKKENIKFLAVSHCTGEETISIFKKEGFNIVENCTGSTIFL